MLRAWWEGLLARAAVALGSHAAGWPALRAVHLKREPRCCCCRTRKNLDVHHVRPVGLYPELELDAANVMTLCRPCHFLVAHLGDWRSWNPLVRADAAWLRNKVDRRIYLREPA